MASRRLIFQVLVGETRPLWTKCVQTMAVYCRRHGITHHVQTEPMLKIRPNHSHRSINALRLGYLPIYEKANALARLGEFDQVAIADADVWAQPDAPDIFDAVNPAADFAGCVEREMPITAAYARKLDGYASGQYGRRDFPFMNMGVMVLNVSLRRYLLGQSPEEFIRRPEFEDFVNGKGAYRWSTDQTLYNVWLRSCGATIQHLPWAWNALFGALTTLEGAHWVHFFLGSHLSSDDPEEMIRTGKGRARV